MGAGTGGHTIPGGIAPLGRYPIRLATFTLFAALLFSLAFIAYGTSFDADGGSTAPWVDVSDLPDHDRNGDEAPDRSPDGGGFGVVESGDDSKAQDLGLGANVDRLRSADALLRNNPASADFEPAGLTLPPQLLERPPPRR